MQCVPSEQLPKTIHFAKCLIGDCGIWTRTFVPTLKLDLNKKIEVIINVHSSITMSIKGWH